MSSHINSKADWDSIYKNRLTQVINHIDDPIQKNLFIKNNKGVKFIRIKLLKENILRLEWHIIILILKSFIPFFNDYKTYVKLAHFFRSNGYFGQSLKYFLQSAQLATSSATFFDAVFEAAHSAKVAGLGAVSVECFAIVACPGSRTTRSHSVDLTDSIRHLTGSWSLPARF